MTPSIIGLYLGGHGLDEEQLLSIVEGYQQEAEKCRSADAYLAGCVMLGAALEASLLAMAKCYPDEVKGTKTYSLKNEPTWISGTS